MKKPFLRSVGKAFLFLADFFENLTRLLKSASGEIDYFPEPGNLANH